MKSNKDMPANPVLHTIDDNWVKEPLDKYLGLSKREHATIEIAKAIIINTGAGVTSDSAKEISNRAIEIAETIFESLEKYND